jgi:hypothetical protein
MMTPQELQSRLAGLDPAGIAKLAKSDRDVWDAIPRRVAELSGVVSQSGQQRCYVSKSEYDRLVAAMGIMNG